MDDRISDWKKYVEQETSKAEQRFKPDRSVPQRQVPELDRDKFRIHRTIQDQHGASRTIIPGLQPIVPKTTQPLPPPAASPMANPIISPFVSARQPEAAPKKTAIPPSAILRNQELYPAANRTPPPAPINPEDGRKRQDAKDQSREEIIERLSNPTITLEEAAKIMGVCKATVRRYTMKGALPHYRTPGNQRRFKLNDIMTFLEAQRR